MLYEIILIIHIARKNSPVAQEMIPHAPQHFLPVGRLREEAGNDTAPAIALKITKKFSSRSDFVNPASVPPSRGAFFHQAGDPFS